MIETIETYVALLGVIAGLRLLAKKVAVPLPILLVLSGLILAFIPNLPQIELNPDIILLFFLPPLIYEAAAAISWADFCRNLRPISLLAFGLVLVTTLAVAVVAHLTLPGLTWPVAFVLGAVVSPPDDAAAIAIMRRLQVPHRLVLILEGEGLVNDATALIAYRFGIAAVMTGSFSLPKAMAAFILILIGELIWGIIVGWVARRIRSWANDTMVEIIVSLMTPFAAFLPAAHFGGSGVLATVAAGLYLGSYIYTEAPSRTRLQGRSFWQTMVFMLNGLLFLLTGLQLRIILERTHELALSTLLGYGVLISAVVIVVRFLWVFTAAHVPRVLSRALRQRTAVPPWQHEFFIAWTGMRGGISLAAALAIPLTTHANVPFPHRDAIIFLTFCVIFVTLVVQGLPLPLMLPRLGLATAGASERRTFQLQEDQARLQAAKAGMARVEQVIAEKTFPHEVIKLVRDRYEDRIRGFQHHHDGEHKEPLGQLEFELLKKALGAERQRLLDLNDQGTINDRVLRSLERDLDLEEIALHSYLLHSEDDG